MIIRKTAPADIEPVMQIYAEAREFMSESGNPEQWGENHPPRDFIERDIREGKSYVCEENEKILAVFYFAVEREPAYDVIEGQWLGDAVYGVIHRIAKGRGAPKGAGRFCIDWCYAQHGNIKIDTHEANLPMRRLLGSLGFVYCGIVNYHGYGERMAFQKT